MKKRTTPSRTKRRISAQRSSQSKCYRLCDPRQLGQVFGTFEGLSELRRLCAREVNSAQQSEQLFGAFYFEDDQSGLQRWKRLFDRITISWRILDQSVRNGRIDWTEFQLVYRSLLSARIIWSRSASRTVPLKLFDRIIDHVREVLISCAVQP